MPGMTCVRPEGRVLRDAEGGAAAGPDRRATTCSACCAPPGSSCVYGSGFGTDPADGFFRVVFLAPPAELGAIYDDMAAYRFA